MREKWDLGAVFCEEDRGRMRDFPVHTECQRNGVMQSWAGNHILLVCPKLFIFSVTTSDSSSLNRSNNTYRSFADWQETIYVMLSHIGQFLTTSFQTFTFSELSLKSQVTVFNKPNSKGRDEWGKSTYKDSRSMGVTRESNFIYSQSCAKLLHQLLWNC